ncbi:hypothetical protein Kpol_462p10 [Vanderwaltozyma polyspora DSM 70294]|uniref:Uncharacterized protein n=1 Tax=Vanderwaltozyma polyspora (strain ATCC 22028 / DSM 70294 / BCRC 21397 / CBS 2163 / NBRC 10782 / NRRL Y-8283 / UCD 57-17) TaxID=436907 RepID=A7TSF1_VANPO|nr:uncharacterized protein Kpol_462p10 [Vanderwaltozyma polyspora DSM 70294]EDO14813.1 hypothetical protein Kpol_462p10 [Vanderwaltozyma polyspora DSM 70294]
MYCYVLLLNQIAGGDNTLCAVLVIINSVLQMILYAPLQTFYCYVVTGGSVQSNNMLYSDVAKSVGVFLGIPLAAGFVIRISFLLLVGKIVYEKKILPFIGPWALIGLHYTILIIFISRGNDFIKEIGSAFLCFIPLTLYFLIAWFGTFFLMRFITSREMRNENPGTDIEDLIIDECGCEKKSLLDEKTYGKPTCGADYPVTATMCFTTASNNFELSLAVAISLYGNGSKQAIAATFGPLLEIPVLLFLSLMCKYFQTIFVWRRTEQEEETST